MSNGFWWKISNAPNFQAPKFEVCILSVEIFKEPKHHRQNIQTAKFALVKFPGVKLTGAKYPTVLIARASNYQQPNIKVANSPEAHKFLPHHFSILVIASTILPTNRLHSQRVFHWCGSFLSSHLSFAMFDPTFYATCLHTPPCRVSRGRGRGHRTVHQHQF